MSSALLEKLKVKPIPKQKPLVAVGLAKGEAATKQIVNLATRIVDKRTTFNRDIGAIRKRFDKSKIVSDLTSNISNILESSAQSQPKPIIQEPVQQPQPEQEKEKEQEKEQEQEKEKEKEPEQEKEKEPVSQPQVQLDEDNKKQSVEEQKEIDDMPLQSMKPSVDEDLTELLKKKPVIRIKKPTKRVLKVISDFSGKQPSKLSNRILLERLPDKLPEVLIRSNSYYMSNREIFINFIASLFRTYKEEIDSETSNFSCDDRQTDSFSALTHQNLVRDYLNIYTPYRGLLLYHGLGSGKTCTSIGIAEGLKSHKQVIIMTPASLRSNFYKELKKCGDPLFRKQQFWEFIKTSSDQDLISTISKVIGLSEDFINKQGGAWLVNVQKPSNYSELSASQQRSLDEQLNEMIENKYTFINYNGLRASDLTKFPLARKGVVNPFDNKVIIIEEAHNFIGRIANKISKKKTSSLSMTLYQLLLSAKNARIVMLTGTPVVNYPNEIGILFNILRGYIKTFTIKLNVLTQRKVNDDELKRIMSTVTTTDYVSYNASLTQLTITRNPFGFVNVKKGNEYKGVAINEFGEIDDNAFLRIVVAALKKADIDVVGKTTINEFKALPDELEEFKNYFISDVIKKDKKDKNDYLKNINLLQRRILGLTSYFRSAQEQLLPKYEENIDFKTELIPMSDYQFSKYEEVRKEERKLEEKGSRKKKSKKDFNKDIFEETVSTYRIFSRAFCNFVFPEGINRPMPGKDSGIAKPDGLLNIEEFLDEGGNEDDFDVKSIQEKEMNPDGLYTAEDREEQSLIEKRLGKADYEREIILTLEELDKDREKYLNPKALETYSPKFLAILENIQNRNHIGCNLIYSQFRTLEGIGIFMLVLKTNGFNQFKLKKNAAGIWDIDVEQKTLDEKIPMFALYTGTEEPEEKEIIRNVFNGEWQLVPRNIKDKLVSNGYENNNLGELIKVLMITASGAEGIDLKNVRYVHLMEPYWHPVRLEQVIGRARRICSHASLPPELRTVEVFLYLMKLSTQQLESKSSYELRLKDRSKLSATPFTTDQSIYEIAEIKKSVNKELLKAIKEASIDCVIYNKANTKEGLKCFTFGNPEPDTFATRPSISTDESDAVAARNVKKITWKPKEITISGVKYALRERKSTKTKETIREIYDLDSLTSGNPVKLGDLEIVDAGKDKGKYKVTWL